jgi:hypothetical protein
MVISHGRIIRKEQLRVEVVTRLVTDMSLIQAAAIAVSADAPDLQTIRALFDIIGPAPTQMPRPDCTYQRPVFPPTPRFGINYLELEAKNASLGSAGEIFILISNTAACGKPDPCTWQIGSSMSRVLRVMASAMTSHHLNLMVPSD